MSIKVKLCGFKERESLELALYYNCDFIGFVFHENSPRNVSINTSYKLAQIIGNKSQKVAVTANCKIDIIKKICDNIEPDYFQFHGNESLDYLENFKKIYPDIGIIKAFPILNINDFANISNFAEISNYFLFDSKVNNKFGGTGIKINWDLFNNVKINKEWFLSGGINIENIEQAINKTKAQLIDMSSAIEIENGKKSPQLIKDIMLKIKELNNKSPNIDG